MKDLGITKGTATRGHESTHQRFDVFVGSIEICSVWLDGKMNDEEKESDSNAELIVNSFDTAQKCGLLPSEILKQRDELLTALKLITRRLNKELNNPEYNSFIDKANKAIENATK